MRLTLFTAGDDRAGAAWRLDVNRRTLTPVGGSSAVKVSEKATTLLVLLAAKRVDQAARSDMGWVALTEVSELRAWVARTSTSLAAQVRREVKHVHLVMPNAIETPPGAVLKGPFRLRITPRIVRQISDVVSGLRLPLARERAVALARSFSRGSSARNRFGARCGTTTNPVSSCRTHRRSMARWPPTRCSVGALCHIVGAKRLREMGGSRPRARQSMRGKPQTAAKAETNVVTRRYLEASAALQLAWLHYRQGDLDSAERAVNTADAEATGSALFRLRGQLLNLRSLIMRAQGRYHAALDDLGHAARLFFAEGDLFHLFAVYHNLACLLAAEAAVEEDMPRRKAMYRQALLISRRNEAYCKQYGIGQNSVVNKLLQVALLRKLGDAANAFRVAESAERKALETQNFPELFSAHRHLLRFSSPRATFARPSRPARRRWRLYHRQHRDGRPRGSIEIDGRTPAGFRRRRGHRQAPTRGSESKTGHDRGRVEVAWQSLAALMRSRGPGCLPVEPGHSTLHHQPVECDARQHQYRRHRIRSSRSPASR